ncbi:site-specific DNA-methyltransferase [Oscillatoria sp. FACHB-1406]|uniref:site-specific DNA-methyltransferase n=1 Tax=Oscillatoria sp. FACHB-1406 TaxID=2692846 RepID=UPI0016891EF5|nr:site-specific DNA-methyltransferase [Oscillatoria sp. FACHB-1406]MBD2579968.1 site-specific DNA-methyltransferase [Oscillatoria sp. FACHB-1406]
MATGIPIKSQFQGNGSNKTYSNYRLEYEGKIPEREILALTPAKFNRVVTVEKPIKNRLIYGDNLRVLKSFFEDSALVENVRLIYIDPPYATGSKFESRTQNAAYLDLICGTDYLEFLRQRLLLLRELLATDGSIYVHLDENMAFPVKIIMDEIFGSRNFRNWITRKKCNPKNYTRKQYGNVSDYILFYSKTANYIWNSPFESWTEETSLKEYQYIEEGTGRRYKKVPIHAPGVRNGETGKPWRGMLPPPGKHWQYAPKTLEEMDARGEIFWSRNGNPRRKVYLDRSKGVAIQDIWLDVKDARNQNIKISGYPTEKNTEMLKRIVLASSNRGDLVLDAFAGSGTTAAVAEELDRPWIAIDNSPLAIATIIRRLTQGTEAMGDFVNPNQAKNEKQSLLKINRILRNGIDLYLEDSPDLEKIPNDLIAEWDRQLNFQANL